MRFSLKKIFWGTAVLTGSFSTGYVANDLVLGQAIQLATRYNYQPDLYDRITTNTLNQGCEVLSQGHRIYADCQGLNQWPVIMVGNIYEDAFHDTMIHQLQTTSTSQRIYNSIAGAALSLLGLFAYGGYLKKTASSEAKPAEPLNQVIINEPLLAK